MNMTPEQLRDALMFAFGEIAAGCVDAFEDSLRKECAEAPPELQKSLVSAGLGELAMKAMLRGKAVKGAA